MKFVNFHGHSTFSLGDATGFPKEHFQFVLENAEEEGMACALTEHGNSNSFGYIASAQKDFKSKGVPFKCVYGTEFYLHPDLDLWLKHKEEQKANKDEEKTDLVVEDESESKGKQQDPVKRRHHLVVWAYNNEGLKNLYRLGTNSYRKGFYRFPRVDFKMLEKHNEGLMISTSCVAGLPTHISLKHQDKSLEERMKIFDEELFPLLDIFGKDRAYLELQFNKLDAQTKTNLDLIEFSKRSGYKLIATADSHYPNPAQWRDRELYRLLARQSKGMDKDVDLPKTIDELKCELFPKNGDQMFEEYIQTFEKDFADREVIKEAIERTYGIAHDMVEWVSPDATVKLPVPANLKTTSFDTLKSFCLSAMVERGLDGNPVYVDRLISELTIIKEKNFAQYFLTLKEALDALRKEMLLGPGRGSGAGSLICYLLQITQIDPIKHNLLFERFISKARKEYPDIDCDVEIKDQSVEILKQYFGEEKVLPVSNYNGLQLKSLVKDVSRFYDVPFQEVNRVTTQMEAEAKPSIMKDINYDQKFYEFNFENAKKYSSTFSKFLEEFPQVGEHIEVLFKQIKSIGKHAGGVVIVDNAEDCMPVIRIRGEDQVPFTQGMTAQHLELFGLIKYDFLGLNTLRYIHKCIERILKTKGVRNPSIKDVYKFYNENLHPDVIDGKDQKVFDYVYRQGRFAGVFQFTQTSAQNFAKRAQPSSVEEISALTAIYRPGPIAGKVDERYVKIKHGEIEIEYGHPIIEEVLGDTKGLLVYQEQFMLLANKLAGFSLEEADNLRKLLVKPSHELKGQMIEQRKEAGVRFIDGCVSAGLTKERATYLWEKEILGFVSYGFNKAHSQSYAFISYICAWLLTYHEKEWLASYIELSDDRDKAMADVASVGYKIAKPDINKSTLEWTADENERVLYPSLTTIKGFGVAGSNELIEYRNALGQYIVDADDFLLKDEIKVLKKSTKQIKAFRFSKFNKRCLEGLIVCEGFGTTGWVGPGKLFENYKHMYNVIIENYDEIKKGKVSIAELAKTVDTKDWTKDEKVALQKELLGTYDKGLLLGEEVLQLFREHDILPLSDVCEIPQNIWFVLKDVIKKTAKSGKKYHCLKIADVDDVIKTLNFFGVLPEEGLTKNAVYIGQLHTKNGWLNVSFGSKLLKAG